MILNFHFSCRSLSSFVASSNLNSYVLSAAVRRKSSSHLHRQGNSLLPRLLHLNQRHSLCRPSTPSCRPAISACARHDTSTAASAPSGSMLRWSPRRIHSLEADCVAGAIECRLAKRPARHCAGAGAGRQRQVAVRVEPLLALRSANATTLQCLRCMQTPRLRRRMR